MKSRWSLIALVALIGLLSYGYVRMDRSAIAPGATADTDFLQWEPTPAVIQEAMRAPAEANNPLALRMAHFRHQFMHRYRQKMMAVALEFGRANRLLLKVPARLEPYLVDRLVLTTWQETRAVFGHPYEIDIIETYIGATPGQVAELRPAADNPQRFVLTHLDPRKHPYPLKYFPVSSVEPLH